MRRATALAWGRWHQVQSRLAGWIGRRRVAISVVAVVLLLASSIATLGRFQRTLAAYLVQSDRLSVLREVLVALGGALVGATVITFSFVMFALQVNVERMPHGLFQRLSADRKLLSDRCGGRPISPADHVCGIHRCPPSGRLGTSVGRHRLESSDCGDSAHVAPRRVLRPEDEG